MEGSRDFLIKGVMSNWWSFNIVFAIFYTTYSAGYINFMLVYVTHGRLKMEPPFVKLIEIESLSESAQTCLSVRLRSSAHNFDDINNSGSVSAFIWE